MAFEWIPLIKDINTLIKDLGGLVRNNSKTKDLLLRELKLNIKSFEDAYRSKMDFDRMTDLLSNHQIRMAREAGFSFNSIKRGNIQPVHIKDDRNKRYINKDCDWLFKNVDEKIEELIRLKKYHTTLEGQAHLNISLKFSNLFFKLRLLADFILN